MTDQQTIDWLQARLTSAEDTTLSQTRFMAQMTIKLSSRQAEIERLREALKALQRQVLQGAVRGDEWMDEALELTRAALQPKEGNQ